MYVRTYEKLPIELVKVKEAGFVIFDSKDYDLNIVGFRKLGDPDGFNQFNDRICIIYKRNQKWIVEEGAATTDPGRYWLTKPDYKPCAIYYHPQQARGAYRLGLHRGKYEALRQVKPAKFWRDGNKDEHLNYEGEIYNDLIYMNIHKSSSRGHGSTYVDRYSAGCQVWQDSKDHERMVELCYLQIKNTGYESFTYTLLSEY
jgi:hypothetical protein